MRQAVQQSKEKSILFYPSLVCRIKYLNVNKEITSLCAGQLNPAIQRELLFVGSRTNLLAYDVEENTDVFDIEVPDGVLTLEFNPVSSI